MKQVFLVFLCVFVILLFCTSPVCSNDDYTLGYVRAVLDMEYPQYEIQVTVADGIVHLQGISKHNKAYSAIVERLSKISGVQEVHAVEDDEHIVEYTWQDFDHEFSGFFPKQDLFKPLLADLMESRTVISYRVNDLSNHGIGGVGYGDVFNFYQWNHLINEADALQVGVEGAVFAYFDLDAISTELQNIDFQVGFPVTYRYNQFSARIRAMHRSSHLGDEYLAHRPAEVWNVFNKQYDENFFDVTVSYEWDWVRVYTGTMYRYDTDPQREPWDIVYGIEFAPWNERSMHPVAGIQFRHQEEFSWSADQRYVAGVKIKDWPFHNRSVQILGEYYNGHSFQLPFFQQSGDYYGLSIYFDF